MNEDINNQFKKERIEAINKMVEDEEVQSLTKNWFNTTYAHQYSYNFSWMGRPIIQYPQDIMAAQEIIWKIQPDLIIETGIAHGGSIIFYSSLIELLSNNGKVIGIDIDIRAHNREAIESHPMFKNIILLEGSSISKEISEQVYELSKAYKKTLVILDSNHTEEHVLRELEIYSPLVKADSYLIVYDTIVEFLPEDSFPDRPWSVGDNPMTAVNKFIKNNDRFIIDKSIHEKLLITVAPNGYLKCTKD